MNHKPLVSINIVLWDIIKWNGGKYLTSCLKSVKNQTYQNIEVNVIDNNSSDGTIALVRKTLDSLDLEAKIFERNSNPGLWLSQEYASSKSGGEYILALSIDTILDPEFIASGLKTFLNDEKVGGVQAKVYAYNDLANNQKRIDTTGFALTHSRKVVNIGHGDIDVGQFDFQKQVFATEGAVPFFRKAALESIRIDGHFVDPDYFWYGDDLDMGWRMTLFGWKQVYTPGAVAYHDRSTTKDAAGKISDSFSRIKKRRQIPIQKRRWDWSNTRFTIIKNDCIINLLRDLPVILLREMSVFFYTLFVEPAVFMEYPRFFRLLPRMLRKRKLIMQKKKSSASDMRQWLI